MSEVTTHRILLLSGPNLELLGEREPDIYGTATLDDLVAAARHTAEGLGCSVEHVQSNHEGSLIDAISTARSGADAIIINPGAFTHYSYALRDSLAAYPGPVVELHLSNPAARESFRHLSVVSPVVDAVISGLGAEGYGLAVQAVVALLARDIAG